MDKKIFEDLPSENTPVKASELNDMQDGIEKSVNYIGSTQPSTGEKVWIKKGKNLFNKNNVINGYRFGSDGVLYAESGYSATDYIEVSSNTQYTVSWVIQIVQCVCYYDENKNFISRNGSEATFTTPSNCKYIRASVITANINSAQIELGSSSTTFEPYIDKEILIKNNAGAFEKFYSQKDNAIYKRGRNLLDMSSIFGLGTLNNDTGLFVKISDVTLISSSSSSVVYNTATKWAGIVYSVSVLPSTQYALKFSTDYPDDDYIIIEGYQKNGTRTRRILANGNETNTFTTNANEYEIKICIESGSLTNTNITISNLQLEQGSTATTFEPYVEKEILVKNDNGIFEKFYSEYQDNYLTSERRIGTWYDGRPLYKKTIKIQNTAFSNGNNLVAHNISNLRQCVKTELVKEGSHIFPYFNYANNTLTITAITNVDSTDILIRCINDSWGNTNIWYATLYYTKTTD